MTLRTTQLLGAFTLLLTMSCGITISPSYSIPRPAVTSEQAHLLATAGVTHNSEWTPYTEDINGVLMALVPPGCFQMGSTDDQITEAIQECGNRPAVFGGCSPSWYLDAGPVHEVCFEEPFWIDVTEVTNDQFIALGGQAERPSHWTDADRPRERISWTEANAFCQKRGARLPTEAEWEYAARGPDGLLYPWGNGFSFPSSKMVQGRSETSNVGSKPGGMSWIGAYDLIGNVAEWVNDWYDDYPSSEQQVNPSGPDGGTLRSLRGLSPDYQVRYPEDFLAANRHSGLPDSRLEWYGFRCALSYQP